MKYIKIFMLMVAATFFVACSSDDESWNTTSNAVVSMGKSEITWKENKGLVNVPITVTGERNGLVQVTVTVAETGSNPAMDDIHYIITSKTIVIPADATSGSIELRTIDDADINENRTFTMTISDVKGATLGDATALITLKDNDSEFYEKLQGTWTMSAADVDDPSLVDNYTVEIVGFDEDEAGYNKTLYIVGFMGYNWTEMELAYEYDSATKEGSVSLVFPSAFATGVNFGSIGVSDVYQMGIDANDNFTYEPLVGKWNDDFTEVTFNEWPAVYGAICQGGGFPDGFTGYVWFGYKNLKLVKKQ